MFGTIYFTEIKIILLLFLLPHFSAIFCSCPCMSDLHEEVSIPEIFPLACIAPLLPPLSKENLIRQLSLILWHLPGPSILFDFYWSLVQSQHKEPPSSKGVPCFWHKCGSVHQRSFHCCRCIGSFVFQVKRNKLLRKTLVQEDRIYTFQSKQRFEVLRQASLLNNPST